MMEDLRKQAERFGTDNRWGLVTDVDFSQTPHKVIVDGKQLIEADAVIIFGVTTPHYLAGYGGGAKSILPGIADRPTVLNFHNNSLAALPGQGRNEKVGPCKYENNPLQLAAWEAASGLPIRFSLKTHIMSS